MSRFTGPRLKVIRRFGEYLPGLTRKRIKTRANPPGEHGGKRFKKPSEYGERLLEKQKVRLNYGLSERQMLNMFRKASKAKGDTGVNLMISIESRLDNVVFRAGFAPTIPSARQLVAHGHVLVNGKKLDIPSYIVKPGQMVSLKEKSAKLQIVQDGLSEFGMTLPSYMTLDRDKMVASFVAKPVMEDVLLDVQLSRIVEFYSRTA